MLKNSSKRRVQITEKRRQFVKASKPRVKITLTRSSIARSILGRDPDGCFLRTHRVASHRVLFYRAKRPPFFFFLLLKRTRFPGKRESILGSVATRYRWRTANKMFVESMERVFAPRQLFLSLPLSLCLFLHLFFLFLPREETLKHAPNRLMFKRARAFS